MSSCSAQLLWLCGVVGYARVTTVIDFVRLAILDVEVEVDVGVPVV